MSTSTRSRFFSSILVLLAAAGVAPTTEARDLIVGTFDRSRCREANVADGEWTTQMRNWLHANGYQIRAFPELTQEAISDVDVLVIHNVSNGTEPIIDGFRDGEPNVLRDFVLGGGGALVLVDGAIQFLKSARQIVAPFEINLEGPLEFEQVGSVTNREHPVVQGGPGPFCGQVTSIRGYYAAWIRNPEPHVVPLASFPNDINDRPRPCLAAIEAGALAPGSGGVVLITDSNPLADATPGGHFAQHRDLFCNIMAWITPNPGPEFIRGDCNDDGGADISDAVCILDWLFQGGAAPDCVAATDTNSDRTADISDAVYLLAHLFLGGPAPAAPFPACGPGLPPDQELGCATPPASCANRTPPA
jgi:hypothetical protein